MTSVTLQLLDSATGMPLQVWSCENEDRVTIGRGEESRIRIIDPHVSRLHAELILSDGEWMIRSHGRNGTWIHGLRVDCDRILDRTVFQMGSSGPMLRFLCQNPAQSLTTATIDNAECDDFDFLRINPHQLADEVARIAESEAFRRLQRKVPPRVCPSESEQPLNPP
jgi:pSer/pThr/pTyr-binding forkhead associated (FHA) protein